MGSRQSQDVPQGRPLMTVMSAQQQVLDQLRSSSAQLAQRNAQLEQQLRVQGSQIALIARLAGISAQVSDLARTADINNPAQPVPDPGEQAAPETTEQALAPATMDDVRAPGQTPNSVAGVPAEATDVPIQPGGTLPTQPFNDLIDVTAPTQGTNTGEVPLDQRRIETDVRVGNPMVPEVAFPWTIGDNQSNSAPPAGGEMGQAGGPKQAAGSDTRFMASLRLARLRVQAGIASGDDVTMAGAIAADSQLPDSAIEREIDTLGRVTKAASQRPIASSSTVPRRTGNARTAPSLASAPKPLGPDLGDDSLMFL